MKFSMRMNGKPTSLSLNKRIVALWLLMSDTDKYADDHDAVFSFVQSCTNDWTDSSAKGLSDYIISCMMADILSKKDYTQYSKIFTRLST